MGDDPKQAGRGFPSMTAIRSGEMIDLGWIGIEA
jgi:hypothetical protein